LRAVENRTILHAWIVAGNYFFEWCVWIGYAIYGIAFPYGWIALGGKALIVTSILKVTGIPATEAQALRSKGDAYRDYQRRVSKFVPLPPKRTRPDV
jgi:steroid 5-alpha reductase family enzyme